MITLTDLQALVEAATAAPWRNSGNMGAVVSDDPAVVAEQTERFGEAHILAYDGAIVFESCEKSDREMLVALRNSAPALLAVVRTAEAWQEKLAATGGFIADHPAAWVLYDEFIDALSAVVEPTS